MDYGDLGKQISENFNAGNELPDSFDKIPAVVIIKTLASMTLDANFYSGMIARLVEGALQTLGRTKDWTWMKNVTAFNSPNMMMLCRIMSNYSGAYKLNWQAYVLIFMYGNIRDVYDS